ncbi:hypothetical protein FEM48_Zijuj03G0126300 [Ziziphus jujuba var. spinosa]|uniref:Uncharacterized protein n=1 Tax=Ziziphus jujuba var. spinosa TaxID=714518 RepID=A0A978VQC7_ZIZJJ|nr:hypothetical protein FEM48_Zijuj03G0126300 [Ziziphus jujuba var. spinosa]
MYLNALDLSGNKFIGKIPKLIWISLQWLVVLNLRSNKFHGEIPLELCSLVDLQILDLSHNNFSGTVPRCFYNLRAMTTLQNSDPSLSFISGDNMSNLMAEVTVVTKRREFEYRSMLKLGKSMDLSSNNLHGEIPVELINIQLQTLNLTNNHLVRKTIIYVYLSLGLGSAFAFWGVLASLLFNLPWNMAFCAFLNRIVVRLYGALL